MKVKSLLLATVILLTIIPVSFAAAEDSPKPVLKSGDVEHFIKTFPQLSKEFEKFGAQYEAKSGDVQIPAALKANQEFLGILKKYGWNEQFFQKFGAIMMGVTLITIGMIVNIVNRIITGDQIDGNKRFSFLA